jgi:hypothetical protein
MFEPMKLLGSKSENFDFDISANLARFRCHLTGMHLFENGVVKNHGRYFHETARQFQSQILNFAKIIYPSRSFQNAQKP